MPWLVRDGKVLATLEVATSMRDRTRGLLGRDGIDGAILLRPARSVHTLRMRFAIDVAFCDRDLRVLKVTTLARNRATLPVRRAHAVIESEAGTMSRWGVRVGDQLDIRGLDAEDPAVVDAAGASAAGAAGAASVIDVRDGRRDPSARREPARGGPGGGAERTDDVESSFGRSAADVVDGGDGAPG